MNIKFHDKKYLDIDFESDEELIRFTQYFTRTSRNSQVMGNGGKFSNRSESTKFYTNSYKLRIPLWKELYKMCLEFSFKFNFLDQDLLFVDVNRDHVFNFCREQIKDTPYQDFDMDDTFDSVYLAVKYKHMKMDLSVSYGKSIFLYLLSKYLVLNKISKKVLITTPTPQLSMQIMGEFQDVNKQNFPFAVWRGGGIKNKDAPVVISNFQYLANVKEEILKEFDTTLHDECHRTSADTYKKIGDKCINVVMTKGVTGSLLEDGSAEAFKVIANTGETIKRVSKRDLINAGRATDGIISFVILSYLPLYMRQKLIDDRYNPSISKLTSLKNEREEILKHEWRTKILISFIKKIHIKRGNGIVFFNSISYGTLLVDLLKKHLPDSQIFYVDKDTPIKERKIFTDYANANDNCIIVGSFGTTSTGVSIKNLNWGLSAEPFKSYNIVEQVIGRFMRLFKGKSKFVFYDVIDDGRITINDNGVKKVRKNYLYSWMESKEKDYSAHEFKIVKQKLSASDKKQENKGLL